MAVASPSVLMESCISRSVTPTCLILPKTQRITLAQSFASIQTAASLTITLFLVPRSTRSVCAMSSAWLSNRQPASSMRLKMVPGGFDEVNRIQAGGNYGWPQHMGTTNAEGITDPIAVFGTWPQPAYGPTGATFPSERPELLLFCAFHVPALHALELGRPNYDSVERELVLSKHCILDTTASSDGWVYYSTITAIYRARLRRSPAP